MDAKIFQMGLPIFGFCYGEQIMAVKLGGAVGHNPIALIVPCHRVVGAGGALTGYAAGLGRKAALLNMEADKQSICKEPIKRHRT